MMARKGISAQMAKLEMRRRTTLIGAMLVQHGEADGMICGTMSTTHRHLHFIDQVIGKKEGATVYAAMNALVLPGRQIFLVDTHVNVDPTPDQLCEITMMAAEEVRRFGIEPKIALLSHSNFGTSNAPSAQKMRDVLALLKQHAPDLEVDGEMHGDVALDARLRKEVLPESTLRRRREPADPAEHRRREHLVQPAQDGGRQQHRDRADPARRGEAGACADRFGDGAAHREHDGAAGGGRVGYALKRVLTRRGSQWASRRPTHPCSPKKEACRRTGTLEACKGICVSSKSQRRRLNAAKLATSEAYMPPDF